MKKVISLLLAGLMLFTFTGCNALDKAVEIKDTVFDLFSREDDPVSELTLEEGILKVGMYMDMPPMVSVTEDTVTPIGFEVDLARALCDSLGLKIQMVDISQDNLLASLDAEMIDCVISSIPLTADNEENYLASIPYADLTQIEDLLPADAASGQAAIFTSSDNDALMKHLNQALQTLIKEGDLSELSQTHFEKDIIVKSEE